MKKTSISKLALKRHTVKVLDMDTLLQRVAGGGCYRSVTICWSDFCSETCIPCPK